MLSISEEQLLISKFFEIISKKGNDVASEVHDKVEKVFNGAIANLLDEEKTDFSNASTKIRRLLDQNLRTFREWLDAEANKKLAQVYESSTAQQEMKLIQSTTSLQILVQIYYMKQIQQQEDFMYSLHK
jgi:type III secretory pathway component EscR